MRIIAVDDERLALEELVEQIRKAEPEAELEGFRTAQSALQFVRAHPVDVAFLDVEMAGMDGISMARTIARDQPACRVVFVTGFSGYALEAFRLHARGYLMKPVHAQAIREVIEQLCTPQPPLVRRPIRVQTFGSFEVFTKAGAVHFGRAKSKELLAYLVDRRGASCTSREIAAVLWEDRPYNNQLKNYVQSVITGMLTALREADAEALIVRKWNSLAVDPHKFDCDYYDLLDGRASRSGCGVEYMSNYSWAEETAARLQSSRMDSSL